MGSLIETRLHRDCRGARSVFVTSLATLVAAALFAAAGIAASQAKPGGRGPILDMHMHARTAAFYGEPPIPLCAPVERMPRWDQRKPMWQDDSPPACRTPLLSPLTDADLFAQTVAMMRKHNVIGVLGGESKLVGEWVAAAPGTRDIRWWTTCSR